MAQGVFLLQYCFRNGTADAAIASINNWQPLWLMDNTGSLIDAKGCPAGCRPKMPIVTMTVNGGAVSLDIEFHEASAAPNFVRSAQSIVFKFDALADAQAAHDDLRMQGIENQPGYLGEFIFELEI